MTMIRYDIGTILQCIAIDDWSQMMGYTGRLYRVDHITEHSGELCHWVNDWMPNGKDWYPSCLPIPASMLADYRPHPGAPDRYEGEALPIDEADAVPRGEAAGGAV